MRKPHRLALASLSILATSALVGGSASAATPDTYAAKASAEALTISVGGTMLTGSSAIAELSSEPLATATSTELLIPGFAEPAPHTAKVAGADGTDEQKPEGACHDLEAAEELPGITRLEVTCPESVATIAGGLPTARALGAEVVIEPSVSEVLSTLGLQDQVTDGVNTVFEDVLDPLVQAITGNPIGDIAEDGVQTVQDVLTDTLTLNSTARIVIAPALATVTTTADSVVSSAHAQGIRIELLPVNELGATNGLLPEDLGVGEPLVTITVGDAFVECTHKRGSDEPRCEKESTKYRAAAVTIDFATTALGEALGISGQSIPVAPGEELCVLLGSPLETCVSVATAGVDAEGNPYATATSVSLFKGVQGGVAVATGAVTSGSAGAAALAAALPAGDLPRTGGSDALPIMGAGLLAFAVLGRRIALGRA